MNMFAPSCDTSAWSCCEMPLTVSKSPIFADIDGPSEIVLRYRNTLTTAGFVIGKKKFIDSTLCRRVYNGEEKFNVKRKTIITERNGARGGDTVKTAYLSRR